MKLLKGTPRARGLRGPSDERGAALLLAFLVMIVVIAITYQIQTVTRTDARVAQNEITEAQMDLAIESALLQVLEDLAEDARAAQAAEGDAGGAGGDPSAGGASDPAAGDPAASGAGAPADNADAVDSQMDGWYTPASTNFGDLQLRILIRDEDSKFNVLNMLQPDEEAAEAAYEIVTRILDNARAGTTYDISPGEAQEMARAMRQHLQERDTSVLPRTPLLSDSEEAPGQGVALSFREFRGLEPFRDDHFFEGYDENGDRVHGIDAFLTVFTSPAMGEETPGAATATGGFAVNVNTAPRAVLDALLDRRVVSGRVWESIVDYRNEVEEVDPNEETEDIEPLLDEFGNEILEKKIFDSLDELEEVYDFKTLLDEEKAEVRKRLTVTSSVFEIIITARLPTQREEDRRFEFESRREQEEYYRSGAFLERTVRAVYWRAPGEDDVTLVPLVRWEVLDSAPLQVLDLPDDRL
ncbi:MAG: type II secretion system protein GspK [Planctomycetota bacterium]